MESSENVWSSGGEIVVPTLEELNQVISEYEKDTISKFVVRRVDKGFGAKGQCRWLCIHFIYVRYTSPENVNIVVFHVPSIVLSSFILFAICLFVLST